MSSAGTIRIGTSGWNFASWRGSFYPGDTSDDSLLCRYAEQFDTVELNNSFYQLPDRSTINHWLRQTPPEFLFSVKASRYLTHIKKLKDADAGLERFLSAIEPFGDKLGPLLFQLPPNWRANPQRLDSFLSSLPDRHRYTFEFRDPSWFSTDIYQLLGAHGAAFCIYDLEGKRSPEKVTTDFVYIRLHGPSERPYEGNYDGRTLAGLARKIRRWQAQGRDIYCYFDNDHRACAPADAMRLKQSLARQTTTGG